MQLYQNEAWVSFTLSLIAWSKLYAMFLMCFKSSFYDCIKFKNQRYFDDVLIVALFYFTSVFIIGEDAVTILCT